VSGRAGAVVVLRPGGTLCVAAVGHYLSDRGLIDHYLPERLELVNRLPKTSSGNVRKQGLQKKVAPSLRSGQPVAFGAGPVMLWRPHVTQLAVASLLPLPVPAHQQPERPEAQGKLIGRRVVRPRQQVEDLIRTAILSGDLHGGERLPAEAELARQFVVSRTTVREALRALSAQGLIKKIPGAGGGSFVQSVDHHSMGVLLQESMHNLLQLGSLNYDEVAIVRQYLEIPAARLAAAHRSETDLQSLRDIVAQQRTTSVDDPEVPHLDARFHAAIAKASGNRVLASFVHALHRETEPVHYLELSPEVGRETVRHHQEIVKAIARQNLDVAESAIVEHLTYLRNHMSPAIVRSRAPSGT